MRLNGVYKILKKILSIVYTDNIGKDGKWLKEVFEIIKYQKLQAGELLPTDDIQEVQVLQDVDHFWMRIGEVATKATPKVFFSTQTIEVYIWKYLC